MSSDKEILALEDKRYAAMCSGEPLLSGKQVAAFRPSQL
jgi:hypothetical protein